MGNTAIPITFTLLICVVFIVLIIIKVINIIFSILPIVLIAALGMWLYLKYSSKNRS